MTSWSGLNQRNFPRVAAKCDIWILDVASGDPIQTTTENVGGGGVCVILREELEKLSTVRLRLTLPGQDTPIECDGRIVWTVRSKDLVTRQVFYDTGIEFRNISSEDNASILAFIEVHV